ncbi:MAG: alpha/beta hydrolase family protein, partial [Pirellulaceae bacterium]
FPQHQSARFLVIPFVCGIVATSCGRAQTADAIKEDVEFGSHQNTTLRGTLWKPAGASEPVPAIVCVHGSGKVDRNGDYITELADYFSRRGVAVLCFDKRGVSSSDGEYVGSYSSSMIVYAMDGLAALDYLRSRDDIASDQVGVFGVSQGGFLIPVLAAVAKDKLAFSIIVSGPTVSIMEQNRYCDLTGISAGRDSGMNIDEVYRELEKTEPKGFGPMPYIAEMTMPALWLFGEHDKSIPIRVSIQDLNEVKQEFDRNFTWQVFPDANHGLRKSKTGGNWERPYPVEPADGYLESIARWLHDTVGIGVHETDQ